MAPTFLERVGVGGSGWERGAGGGSGGGGQLVARVVRSMIGNCLGLCTPIWPLTLKIDRRLFFLIRHETWGLGDRATLMFF